MSNCKKFLYFEGASGISGDMTVAALLELGASRQKLERAIDSLGLGDDFHYRIAHKSSYSIAGCDFSVHLHHRPHCHEEAYLSPPSHHHGHEHEHEHGHHHGHEHGHEHHHHEHRHLADVYSIIDHAEMTAPARALAKKIFHIVAEAEAQAHGVPMEQVHFHEVGAIDSIVDIIAAAVLVDDLAVDGCIITGLSEGHGTVTCQHGELPVPVPAVMNIAAAHGIPLRATETRGEMVTPTGIAIAAALCTQRQLPPTYCVLRTGIGLGKRDFGRANFLRAALLCPVEDDPAAEEQVFQIEANIDDSTPEELGLLLERLMSPDIGARDAWYLPCMMKKGRPAVQLGVLCTAAALPRVEHCILRHSSTIGLRRHAVERTVMERELLRVQLPYGEAIVKKATLGDITRCQPEYESVKKLAEQTGKPFRSIWEDIVKHANT